MILDSVLLFWATLYTVLHAVSAVLYFTSAFFIDK